MFEKRSVNFWFSQQRGTDFEAFTCVVVSLGCYFSGSTPSTSEAQVAEQGKCMDILEFLFHFPHVSPAVTFSELFISVLHVAPHLNFPAE
jgi:hypothetical protein